MPGITALYPGSFDPLTNGHLDVIARASRLFNRLIVAVLRNSEKQPLFSVTERMEMLRSVIAEQRPALANVEVTEFSGLRVDYAEQVGAQAVVRGIRAISDYEYEFQMALMNRRLAPQLETVFMVPAEAYSYVSSRLVKEVFRLGRPVEGLVPALVETRLRANLGG